MTADNRKFENANPRPEKPEQDQEKVNDLPIPQQSDKDAQQVKGGRKNNV